MKKMNWTKTAAQFYEANKVIVTYAKSNNAGNLCFTQEELEEIIEWNNFKMGQIETAKKKPAKPRELSDTAKFILDTLNTYTAVSISDLAEKPVIANTGLTYRNLTGSMNSLVKRGLVERTFDEVTGKRLYKLV